MTITPELVEEFFNTLRSGNPYKLSEFDATSWVESCMGSASFVDFCMHRQLGILGITNLITDIRLGAELLNFLEEKSRARN